MRTNHSRSTSAVRITIGLAALVAGALGAACSGADTPAESTEYTTQGVCAAGDTRIDDVGDDADDGGGAGAGHAPAAAATAHSTKLVHCRKGHAADAGAAATGSTCKYFAFTAYGACQPDGTQTRTIVASSPLGCTGGSPVLERSCTYVPEATTDAGTSPPPPPPPPTPTPTPTTCSSFTYSAWGACQANGTQTRTVLSSSPSGCTGGSPITSQSCTYIDGAALYTQYCSGCHGNAKKGSSATNIQNAINNNTGGMGSLKSLTPAQILAISQAP
jgi:hypothetical protein